MTGSPTPLVVVMGVSGSGKTTVGRALAQRLDLEFVDGDDLHPPQNVERMRRGQPLDDAARMPWLREVGDWLHEHTGSGGVVACSALRRTYRDLLRADAPGAWFLHLHGSPQVLRRRMRTRPGHFMPETLLDSQLRTLEPLQPDEPGLVVDVDRPVDAVVAEAVAALAVVGGEDSVP